MFSKIFIRKVCYIVDGKFQLQVVGASYFEYNILSKLWKKKDSDINAFFSG